MDGDCRVRKRSRYQRADAPRQERTNTRSSLTTAQIVVRWTGPSGAWVSIRIVLADASPARTSESKGIGQSFRGAEGSYGAVSVVGFAGGAGELHGTWAAVLVGAPGACGPLAGGGP